MLLDLIATSTFGLEAVVARELAALGYEGRSPQTGRVEFSGDASAVARTNLWLRCADRVLIRIGRFEARDFEDLFQGIQALPWERWIAPDARFPVSGRSVRSQLSSVPAIQRCAKKAIVGKLMDAHSAPDLPETGATVAVEVALLKDVVTLTIDTSGDGLHKRGYRDLSGPAPLRETLAAALVQLTFWHPDRPLIDPFCGSGTICIEAAMIGRGIAPGLNRPFSAEFWPTFDRRSWEQARAEARAAELVAFPERIIGTDLDEQALSMARRHAERAGVADVIHFQQKSFDELSSKRRHGCVIMNPPYGKRVSEQPEVQALYASMPLVLRRLPTWSFFILTSWPDFEGLVGRPADRRRKLYNGPIECTYYQFHGPKPGEPSARPTGEDAAATSRPSATPVFGGLGAKAREQAEVFGNRLRKMDRHRRRWPTRRGITCYRIYNREVPEVPLMVDRYEDYLHIGEYQRPHERSPAEHADWLDLMVATAGRTLDVPAKKVFCKRRQRQRGLAQYEKTGAQGVTTMVREGGLRFEVNLSDYVDTGLFLDHRQTRDMFRQEAGEKRVLNLFGYTGAFSVYALDGVAKHVTTVDLSRTYLDWARRNHELNQQDPGRFDLVQTDARRFLSELPGASGFDLAIVDPPTFSNSKRTDDDWDVQVHHAALLNSLAARMSPNGVIYFSTNFRRFKLDKGALMGLEVLENTQNTVPEDFANKRTHRCWRMVVRA